MKHYLSHDASGRIIGIHSYKTHATGLHGWPDHIRPHEVNPTHAIAQNLRKQIVEEGDAEEIIPYVCPCSPTDGTCRCTSLRVSDSKVVNGQVVIKPIGALFVDGAMLAPDATIKRPPASALSLHVVCGNVPDGAKVQINQLPNVVVLHDDGPIDLVFAAGHTSSVSAVAPAQGATGTIFVTSNDIQPIRMKILGWALA